MSESDTMLTKEMIEGLKKEIGDKFGDMKGRPLEGITKKEFRDNLIEAVKEVWASSFKDVLPEEPEIEFFFETGGWVKAKPKNESALRVMQVLNMMKPTHRIKPRGAE